MDESGLLRELFDMVDEDGSGSIDKMELRTFLLTLPKMSDSKVGEIMKTADEDQSGEVEFDEFVTVLSLACRDLPTDEVIGTFREVRDKKAIEMKERMERFNKAGGEGAPPPTLKRKKSVVIKTEPEPPAPAAPQSNEELEEMKRMLAKATETIGTISSEMKSLQESSASQAASQDDQIKTLKQELEREKARVAEEAQKKEEALKKQLEEAWEKKAPEPSKAAEVGALEERLKKAERALKEQESELKAAKQAGRARSKSRLETNSSQFRRLRPELKIVGGGSQGVRSEDGEKAGLYAAPGSVQAQNAGVNSTIAAADGPAYNPLSRRAPARGKPPVLGRVVQRGTRQQMLAFCMGCGAGHRGNLTPHSTPPSQRVGAGGMGNMSAKTEYYCRACKRKTRRELRDSAPNPSELSFPVDESQNLWYCLNCGTREFSGRAAGAREKGYCDRCSQFSSFICQVSTLNPPVGARFANDRMLFCQGCGMEEWALEGDKEFGEHQLYCCNCCGTTAWRCQCWAKSTRTRLPCPNGPLPLWELALRAD